MGHNPYYYLYIRSDTLGPLRMHYTIFFLGSTAEMTHSTSHLYYFIALIALTCTILYHTDSYYSFFFSHVHHHLNLHTKRILLIEV